MKTNQKGRLLSILLLAVGVSLALPCLPSMAGEGLVFSTHTTKNYTMKAFLENVEELATRTDGYIKVKDEFYSQALVKGTEQLKSCGKGISDVACICAGYSPASVPLTILAEIPYVTEKGDAVARAMTELYETYKPLRDEYRRNNVEVLAFDSPTPTIIGVNKVINSADDLRGMKVRAYGLVGDIVSKGGMVPVAMGLTDIYTSMQTKMIQGYTGIPLWQIYPQNFLDVTKTIISPGIGTYYICSFVMNLDVYNRLPQAIKNIIWEMRRGFPQKCTRAAMEANQLAIQASKEVGANFYKFTPEEIATWKKRAKIPEFEEKMIKLAEERGAPQAREFLELYRKTVKKYEPTAVYREDFPE